MQGRGLGEAARLYRARRFPDVIRLLEPLVFRFRESFDFYLLLGLSCLRTGDLGGAQSYLARARQISDDDVRPLLGLAAIHFKKAETEQALTLWLEVVDREPGNRVARRGMGILRKGITPERLHAFVESGGMRGLFPPLPPRGRVFVVLAAFLGACILIGAGWAGYRYLEAHGGMGRPGISAVDLPPGGPSLVDGGAPGIYTLTEREVYQTFREAKKDLLGYRDNLAVVEINRLLLSNAALPVKERARLLKGFVTRATFTTLRDPYSYRAVSREPGLYDGASVMWRGKVANLSVGKERIAFDLLVGYEMERELEGIVPVTLRFAAQLENGVPLEVLGAVSSADGILRLEGISLHRLSLP
jgi:hypothetical protein